MHLVINGSVPGLKNQKQLFVNRKTGKNFITSSVRAKEWTEAALWQLKGKPAVISYPVAITMVFYFEDNRKRDLDNVASTVLDVLRKANIIVEDDWQHVRPITIDCGGIGDPRVEVWLDEG